MARHFQISVESLKNGRLWTAFTSSFSHRDGMHLLTNMIGLYFFGSEVGQLFGGRFLLSLYMAGALGCSISHVLYYTLIVPQIEKGHYGYFRPPRYSPPALGASGAVNALVLFYCLLFPSRIIYLNLILPVPAVLLGAAFIFQDIIGAVHEGSRTAHAGHLGGAFVGLLAWLRDQSIVVALLGTSTGDPSPSQPKAAGFLSHFLYLASASSWVSSMNACFMSRPPASSCRPSRFFFSAYHLSLDTPRLSDGAPSRFFSATTAV
eukprot:SM000049S16700  [mRNA]  locus=s49:132098:136369:- [translate_table: standard]